MRERDPSRITLWGSFGSTRSNMLTMEHPCRGSQQICLSWFLHLLDVMSENIVTSKRGESVCLFVYLYLFTRGIFSHSVFNVLISIPCPSLAGQIVISSFWVACLNKLHFLQDYIAGYTQVLPCLQGICFQYVSMSPLSQYLCPHVQESGKNAWSNLSNTLCEKCYLFVARQ